MACPCKKPTRQQQNLYVMSEWINMEMQKDPATTPSETAARPQPAPRANDVGTVNVSGYIKIFDPNSKETLVEARE